MKFIDEVKIWVKSGDGGNGSVSFRREKYVPRGGPDGGDGGKGGDVVFETNPHSTTLYEFLHKPHYKAGNGGHGQGKKKTGRGGHDVVISVPVGTLIKDPNSGSVLHDLSQFGQRVVFLQGGRGGRGNIHFVSPARRAPRKAENGEPGQETWIRLELKLLADVGLIGLPNAGKSTLLGKLTASRPKIGDYPFTTLAPKLGVLNTEDGARITLADIPGLIKDAHKGHGLGIRFLKHIERTKALLFLIDANQLPSDDLLEHYRIIRGELSQYSERLCDKPYIVALNKMDLITSPRHQQALEAAFRGEGIEVISVSALSGVNLERLVQSLVRLVYEREQKGEPQVISERVP